MPGKTLGSVIDQVITESTKTALYRKGLAEKEKQVVVAKNKQQSQDGGDSQKKDGLNDKPMGGADNTPSATVADDTEALAQGKIDVDNVIEKFNAIRSGKSFKDDGVHKAFEQYFNSLSEAERIALLAFAKGIAQIVTGEVQGGQAVDPSENPSNIDMVKKDTAADGSGEEKKVNPKVIKVPEEKPAVKKASNRSEDTSAPVVVKKRA